MNRFISISLWIALAFSFSCGVPEEEHTELNTQLASAQNALKKAQEELDLMGTTVEEKNAKVAELQEQIKSLNEDNALYTGNEDELKKKVADLETQIKALEKEKDDLKATATDGDVQQAAIEKLQADLATAGEEAEKWKGEYQAMRDANEKLQARMEEIQDRPKDDFLFSNSLVRYLQQTKKSQNEELNAKADLTDDEKSTLERNNALLAKSSKELTAEMGDYYSEKGTLDQMGQKYPDFREKYELILKLREENKAPAPE